MKKFSLLLIMLLVVGLFATIAIGCDDHNNDNKEADYTIIVNGLDGKPSEGISVQVCKVGPDGALGTCYAFPDSKVTDKDGKLTLNIKDDNMDAENDWIEVHLQGLPPYLTYPETRMHKGDTKTINIIESFSTPEGKGTAEYKADENVINTEAESFDPYRMEYDIVHTGAAYIIKFEKADQKIYIEYNTLLEFDYKLYSISGIELKLTELIFNNDGALINAGDDKYTANGTDLNYKFATEHEQGDGYVSYFELELVNSTDVDKEIKLCFEIDNSVN